MSSEDSLDRSVLSRRFQLALLLMAAQATLTGVPFKATRKSYTREFKLKVVAFYRDYRGRGLKQLAFRHLPLFKHPFCRYCPDKHRCLKTGTYGISGALHTQNTQRRKGTVIKMSSSGSSSPLGCWVLHKRTPRRGTAGRTDTQGGM